MSRTGAAVVVWLMLGTVLLGAAPSASAHKEAECTVATLPPPASNVAPVAGLVACVETRQGLAGFFDEACDCWTRVTLFGFGAHSAALPANGSMELVYRGEVLATDRCAFPDAEPPLLPLMSCKTRGQATVHDAPSGFCFEVTATTTAMNDLDRVSHTHTFCAPR